MMINNNFVIRNILGSVMLFPVKVNSISNDPIYINNTIYQILINATAVDNKDELIDLVSKLFSPINAENIGEISQCIDNLVRMGLICEEGEHE